VNQLTRANVSRGRRSARTSCDAPDTVCAPSFITLAPGMGRSQVRAARRHDLRPPCGLMRTFDPGAGRPSSGWLGV
jgi:hypothetical protein